MKFLFRLVIFIGLWTWIACETNEGRKVDYRSDWGGLSAVELCAQYPNGAVFPNLLLSCMSHPNEQRFQELKRELVQLMESLNEQLDKISADHRNGDTSNPAIKEISV